MPASYVNSPSPPSSTPAHPRSPQAPLTGTIARDDSLRRRFNEHLKELNGDDITPYSDFMENIMKAGEDIAMTRRQLQEMTA